MSISKFITSLPTVKVFTMTDADNHPFILSFHYEENSCNPYFQITPNRSNPITKVPVYEGICYTINTFMDMLVAYGCKYIKRLPIEKGEILSRDYLDGLADGTVITKPVTATPNSNHNTDENTTEEDNWLYDFIDELLDGAGEIDKNGDFELPF